MTKFLTDTSLEKFIYLTIRVSVSNMTGSPAWLSQFVDFIVMLIKLTWQFLLIVVRKTKKT